MMAMGQPAPQMQAMGQPAAAAGFAAIPTLPTNTALTLTFDVIRIPIPIPRLRTVDVPPETRLSFVQLGGASAVGAVASAPTGVMMAQTAVAQAPVMQAGFAAQGVEAQGASECIRPEHIAAAAALMRSQRGGSQSAGASAASAGSSSDEERINKQLKQLEDLEKKLDDATKTRGRGQSNASPSTPWRGADDHDG